MLSIRDSLQRAERQRLSYRAAAASAMSVGGGGGGLSPYSLATSTPFDPYESSNQAAQLYALSSRGHAYTAIRPVAVRIADQAVRVGYLESSGSKLMKRLVEKAYCGDDWRRTEDERQLGLMKQFAPSFIKQQARNIDPIVDHPLLATLANPNDYMTGWALFFCTAYSIEGVGEALWVLDNVEDEDGSSRLQIFYIPRSWMDPIKTPDGNPFGAYKWVLPNVASEELPPIPGKNVCHFMKPNPANPTTAHSGTQAQGLAIHTDEEIQKAQFFLTRNMSRPGLLVQLGDLDANPATGEKSRPELTTEQRAEIAAQVRLHYTTAARFGDPLILDRLIHDVRPYMPSPADVDYKDGSVITKSRIFEGFGTNPLVTGQVQDGNRAQAYVAHDSLNFIQVNPLCSLMSETMTKKLGPLYDGENGKKNGGGTKLVIWIDQAQAKDPDLVLKRMELGAKLPGVFTLGEIRKYVAGLDYEYVPKDDDEEPAGPAKPDPAAQGGLGASTGAGPFPGAMAGMNPYSLRQWGDGAFDGGLGDSFGGSQKRLSQTASSDQVASGNGIDGIAQPTVSESARTRLEIPLDHPLAVAIKSGQVLVGSAFTAELDSSTWTQADNAADSDNADGSVLPTPGSASGVMAVVLERRVGCVLPGGLAVLPGGSVDVRLVSAM